MWELHNLAAAYGRLPSAIVGITDELAAYQFNLAVLNWGREVENEASKGKNARDSMRRLRRKLGATGKRSGRSEYAGLSELARMAPLKRIKTPKDWDGIW